MQVYQVDTLISDKGTINLPMMPYLYSKKVKLVIIPAEDSKEENCMRNRAMATLLEQQKTMPVSYWTDEELDNFKCECLKTKHI
jgi:hypothetical protein